MCKRDRERVPMCLDVGVGHDMMGENTERQKERWDMKEECA